MATQVMVVSAVLAASLVEAQPASAAWEGRNGDLSFVVTNDDGSSHQSHLQGVWRAAITRQDGSDARAIYSCANSDPEGCDLNDTEGPTWSPSGKRLAFGLAGRLAIVNADGSRFRELPGLIGGSPVWSPNGKRLAFVGEGGELHTVRTDGGAVRRLTNGAGATDVTWSPRGVLAYTFSTGSPGAPPDGIATIDARGKGEKVLVRGGTSSRFDRTSALDWSPDGRHLLFHRDGSSQDGLWTVDTSRRRVKRLVRGAGRGLWSPDGRSIAYHSGSRIFVARADGTRPRPIDLSFPGDWGNGALQGWQAIPRD